MYEEEIMTAEEINQSYVTLATRVKGPPSITVKVVNKDPNFAGEIASGIFNHLTEYYKEWYEKQNPPESDVVDGGEVIHGGED